jgi:hypothetical protein
VLRGKDFGGGHEYGLATGGDCGEHRVDGNGRLTGADVGLQEPVHGLWQCKVIHDLLDCLVLARCEAEFKEPPDAGVDLSGHGDGRGEQPARGLAAQGESELKFEEVVEEHAATAGFPLGAVWGDVQSADGCGELRELVLLAVEGGERICEGVFAVFDGRAGHPSHGIHADAFGERIAGEHADAFFRIFVGREHMHFGVAEFPAPVAAARFAMEEQTVAVLEATKHPRLVKPQTADEVAVAVEQNGGEAAAVAKRPTVAVGDDALNRLQNIGLKLRNGAEAGEVVDVVRDVKEQIAGGFDVEVFQEQGALWPDAAEELDWCEQSILRGGSGEVGRNDRRVIHKGDNVSCTNARSKFVPHSDRLTRRWGTEDGHITVKTGINRLTRSPSAALTARARRIMAARPAETGIR